MVYLFQVMFLHQIKPQSQFNVVDAVEEKQINKNKEAS